MKTKEFDLSGEIVRLYQEEGFVWLNIEDVKKYIKLDFNNVKLAISGKISWEEYLKRRNKLAGDKLIEGAQEK